MTSSEKRLFLRTASRTAGIEDERVREDNLRALDEMLNEMISKKVLTDEERIEYSHKLYGLRIKEKPAGAVKPSTKPKAGLDTPDVDIAAERTKHEELMSEMINLTNIVKHNVQNVNAAMHEDESVLEDVQDAMRQANESVVGAVDRLDNAKSERLGYKAYVYFIAVVIVFLLVR